jgi:hypothetical protein
MDVWTLGGYLLSMKYNQLPILLMPLTPSSLLKNRRSSVLWFQVRFLRRGEEVILGRSNC